MKKKILLMFVLFLAVALFSACNGKIYVPLVTATAPNRPADFDPDSSDLIAKFTESLKNKDSAGFKSVFSKTTVATVTDLDSKIQAMFDYIEGDITEVYNPNGEDSKPFESGEKSPDGYIVDRYYSYVAKTANGEYEISFVERSVDSAESDNIGIYSVYVSQKGRTDPVFEDDPDEAYNIPGVHIANK